MRNRERVFVPMRCPDCGFEVNGLTAKDVAVSMWSHMFREHKRWEDLEQLEAKAAGDTQPQEGGGDGEECRGA